MRVIEAIQERLGPHYTTLPDALDWYGSCPAQTESFDAEYYFKPGKTAFKSKLRSDYMEERILRAWKETHGKTYHSIADALTCASRCELLDCWLNYEGIVGYTSLILSVMEELGYDLSQDE
jgi:hypothetical protein